ncbi:MAG TPA: AarF/ABC1/UbiB kinase family protein, partial [Myxococcales bacterium]|nr:AarF/ABC1/UbiB kinase family protein [Myxococcales bacterium]
DRAEPLLAKMTREPVAAASIGQVHRSTLPSGEQVAVKVQYPGIDKAIAADFRAAGAGTHFIQLLAPGAGVPGVLREARAALLEECDYQREARYQDRFAQVYAGHPTLWVPPTYGEYGSRRVLTTRWVDGLRLEAFIATQPSQDQRDRVGRALFEFYVGTLFRHRLYNWDPHPGNYLFLSDGKLAMLDYGSTRDFDAAFVKKLAALTLAVHADRPSVLHAALADLAMVSDFGDYDYETARSLVRSFFGPMLKDDVVAVQRGEARPLKDVMASKRQLLKLHLPAQIVFILRIRYGLMAVLAQLGARANWYQMERSWAEHAVS